MVCGYFDVQPNSKTGRFVGNRLVSIIVSFLQFILYISALVQIIIKPASVKTDPNTGNTVGVILILLVFIGFCVLLIIGIFKSNEKYINMYLIANVVITSMCIIGFFTILFTSPLQYGVGFIYSLIAILQNLLFLFIIRNYSLALHSKRKEQIRGPI